MTPFRELRRIEHAIEQKNEAELRWTLGYCAMRPALAATVHTMRKQEKYCRQLESQVRTSLENPNRDTALETYQPGQFFRALSPLLLLASVQTNAFLGGRCG
jgi:hypothetical protein